VKRKLAVVYTGLVGVPLATLLVVLTLGQNLFTAPPAGEAASAILSAIPLLVVFIILVDIDQQLNDAPIPHKPYH
jgi:hypothetical protein